jgi:hypothetical protein
LLATTADKYRLIQRETNMTTCAVVNSDNQVVNLIVAEPTDTPPEGCTLVEVPFCDIGYTWDGTRFNPPQAN